MTEDVHVPIDLSMKGMVALVTGGTRGIGKAIAERLLEAGAEVAVCARSEPETLPGFAGRDAVFFAGDVRRADQCRTIVDQAAAHFGRLDLLVNNAGGSPAADAATASPRFSESIVALNLLAPIHLSQAAHGVMAGQPGGGSIINIASVAARRPAPGTAVYGAAKAGLLGLTVSLAQEWGPRVRVNAIVVGLVETENAEQTYGSAAALHEIAAATPMGRMGRGADVADAVLYLASPLARFVSGASLEVHGGGEKPHFLDIVARSMSKSRGGS
ncbi:SDR family oxidoreductase [Aquibium sp. ELW1220]|uniref:SDR family oxidoreductase n=1 Tax=Aquibium sp. ELW1220 TaxID=2976766 RepID=UPI0025AEECE4|nr:SDR family oxidoreductase [Aquibium sp. ELW1220]MDN2583342.1 SDR family oxidoreductase [Aquibium sp. ELW1220]